MRGVPSGRGVMNKKKKGLNMKLEINVPVSAFDLAKATQGEQGTYLCQQGGQNFPLAAGHSIKLGPTPIGRRFMESPNTLASPAPWTLIAGNLLRSVPWQVWSDYRVLCRFV